MKFNFIWRRMWIPYKQWILMISPLDSYLRIDWYIILIQSAYTYSCFHLLLMNLRTCFWWICIRIIIPWQMIKVRLSCLSFLAAFSWFWPLLKPLPHQKKTEKEWTERLESWQILYYAGCVQHLKIHVMEGRRFITRNSNEKIVIVNFGFK